MAQGFLLFLLFSYIISINIHACNQIERCSLLSFASTLSSPPLNWTSLHCCHWKGITCDQDGWVTHLLLPSKGLKGDISPSSLRNLTHLTHLNLSHNSLYGSLETQFLLSSNRLEILDLSYNHLYGELSLSLPSRKIRILDLSSNHFFGAIPSSFFQQASNLTSFNVSNNTFTGYVPSSICLNYSPFVRLLDFSSNEFGGNLALGLGECFELQVFRAGHNNLSGLLPEDIYNATKLEEIALPMNSLRGVISDKIVNLTNLKILDLSLNQLSGKLPLNLGKLSKLKFLTVYLNNLEGEGMPFDDGMVDFDGFQNLRALNMAGTNLTGEIPVWLSKLKNLGALILAFNQITGPIPSWLGNLPRLFFINLSYNQISGEFPKQLCRLPRLVYEPIASQVDQYEFELPVYNSITTNQNVQQYRFSLFATSIDLSNNNIVGDIPTEIGQLHLLCQLALHSNNFSGVIPDQISNLKNLEVLDLSMNHLSGRIPLSLASLTFLKTFNVSYNNLGGPIPTSTQIQTFNTSAFEGNLKLCGAPLSNKCGSNKGIYEDDTNNKDLDNEPHQLPWFYIFTVLGFIVGFWGVCGSLVVNKTWRCVYFRFIDNIQDRLYVMVTMRINTMKRRLRS
ncbi:receptor-like protein 2 isoform X2 [Prunus avium]|uniref:Receptor-like protein 2 isoform X2 n=1 Tax=Prunus avium TaxID=42229 RepID=A0A6P5SU10_PRUAV|nr:receptor-like protein 2 isoform X2 [Prunus avium]